MTVVKARSVVIKEQNHEVDSLILAFLLASNFRSVKIHQKIKHLAQFCFP